jgi:FKBP-type peptidyl-prolyl cis-trans isomerase 2
MTVGEKKTVKGEPEKAYGKRNPSNIKLVPAKVFKSQKINPVPGMPVEVDGMRGRIQTVAGGRVRVDFNHELSGKTLVFDVELVEKAKDNKEKAEYLIARNFESSEGFNTKLTGKKLEVTIPKDAYRDRNLLVRKAGLSAEAFKHLGLSDITYVEHWENPKSED